MPEISPSILSKPLEVGGVTLRNRAFLAPMSGVTDVPFRKLCWEFGAGMVVSEMVASQAVVEGEAEMQLKMQAADIPLHIVQIAGREAHWMALAAKMAEANGAHIVDINMGCPAKRVTTGYSGSALMRDLDHALELIEAVVEAVEVPVTLKMRLGWDHQSVNAPELAKRAEDAGVQMVTVHGRTRCQFYKGIADWETIRMVRETITLPLVVNGDVVDQISAERALEQSGADAIMVGRGAYGAPWKPGQLAGNKSADVKQPSAEFVKRHHEAMLSFYGVSSGTRQARKHLGWYMDSLDRSEIDGNMVRKMMTSFDVREIYQIIDEIFGYHTSAFPTEAAA
ncbi:MAG: tRNA dihydrouridine synthase DusB [Pseudomonadota bacterium]